MLVPSVIGVPRLHVAGHVLEVPVTLGTDAGVNPVARLRELALRRRVLLALGVEIVNQVMGPAALGVEALFDLRQLFLKRLLLRLGVMLMVTIWAVEPTSIPQSLLA